MKTFFLAVLLALVFCGLNVGAGKGASLPSNGVGIGGYSYTTPAGPIASVQNVAQAAGYTVECINMAIVESTEKILRAMEGQKEAMKVVAKANLEAQLEMLKQIELARTASDLKRKTDPEAQAQNSCDARDGAAAFGVGRMAEGKTRVAYNNWNAQNSDGKTASSHEEDERNDQRVAVMKGEDPLGNWLFPDDGLIRSEEERNRALELARESVNPRVTPKPDENQSNVFTREALFSQTVKKSRLAVAHDTNNDIIAAHMGLIDAGAVLQSMEKSMGTSEGGVAEDANGRVSIMTYLDVWSKSRFGNPNWFQELFGAVDEMRLKREAVFMQALQVEMQRRQLLYAMRNAQMLSTILGVLVERQENPRIYQALAPARKSGVSDASEK
jgi:hypothetical protein